VNVAKNLAPPHQTIDMGRALEDCEVLYFFLQMDAEAPTLRQIASFAFFTLVEAAKFRCYSDPPLPQRHAFVIMDEFYHIAGTSFGELLSTVRGWGLHTVLANQSMAQLKNHDENLPDVVKTNVGVEQAYTLQPDDEEYFQRAAGERSEFVTSFNISTRSSGTTFSERKASYLSDVDLKRANDTRLASLVIIDDGKPKPPGRRVLKVQGYYPVSRTEYQRYERTPFPKRQFEPVTPGQSTEAPVHAAKTPEARRDDLSPDIVALDQRMATKWRELESGLV
jgi:type IV secretory pathway TraG/TraD family ATPase VirD4